MGMIRSQQHDWAGSLAIFQQQAGKHPQDPLLQYLYAEALAHDNSNDSEQNTAKAIAAVKKALETGARLPACTGSSLHLAVKDKSVHRGHRPGPDRVDE